MVETGACADSVKYRRDVEDWVDLIHGSAHRVR